MSIFNPEIRKAFIYAFEDDCIQLLIKAYKAALIEKKYHLDWFENDFSELLRHYVNVSELSLEKGITCKTEEKKLIETDNQMRGFSDKLPRIDFVYFKIWSKQRFEYFMEAKRLKENDSHLKSAYIKEGMERFISKKYPKGSMIGYLLEGKTNETIKGINSLLEKHKRNSEVLNHKTHNLVHNYYESVHSEIGVLKHIIFEFI